MNEKKLKQLYLVKRLVLVAIIIYIILFIVLNTSYLSIDNLRRFGYSAKTALTQTSATKNDIMSFSADESPVFSPFKDGFAVLNDSLISVYSKDNIRFSYHSANFRHPVMRVSDEYILCYDRGGKTLKVFNSFDLLFEKEFSDIIINATIDNSGKIAVLTDKNGYKGQLIYFDSSFKERFLWYSADTYPIDVAFTSTNTVSVVTVAQELENLNTVVYYLNYAAGEERGNIVSKGTFPISVAMKSDASIEVLSESGLVSFRSGGCSTVYNYGSQLPHRYYQGDKYTVISHKLSAQNDSYTVSAFDVAGNRLFENLFSNVRSVSSFSDTVFVLTTDTFYILDSTGNTVSETEAPAGVTGIVPGRYKIVLFGAEKAYIYTMSDFLK
jgi:hypothetical protein